MRLTKYFTLEEFTFSNTAQRFGINNQPQSTVKDNLHLLAQRMEQVRALLNAPVRITSGYRSPMLNQKIGGSSKSAHMDGLACDFVCRGYGSPLVVSKRIAESDIAFDQLIFEGSWVHFGIADNDRREIMTANFKNGIVNYSRGINDNA